LPHRSSCGLVSTKGCKLVMRSSLVVLLLASLPCGVLAQIDRDWRLCSAVDADHLAIPAHTPDRLERPVRARPRHRLRHSRIGPLATARFRRSHCRRERGDQDRSEHCGGPPRPRHCPRPQGRSRRRDHRHDQGRSSSTRTTRWASFPSGSCMRKKTSWGSPMPTSARRPRSSPAAASTATACAARRLNARTTFAVPSPISAAGSTSILLAPFAPLPTPAERSTSIRDPPSDTKSGDGSTHSGAIPRAPSMISPPGSRPSQKRQRLSSPRTGLHRQLRL
jgi:hypothetical protein